MRRLLLSFCIFSLLACSKSDQTSISSTNKTTREAVPAESQKPPGPIGGGGTVAPQPTYLSPIGGGSYTCQYAGITVNFTSVSWPLTGPATRTFEHYGTYYTVDGYANATTSSSNASGGGSGNQFSFMESYCTAFDANTLCVNWATRTFSGYLVRVLNPEPGAPSFMALVPPSFFTGYQPPIVPEPF